mgnify:CR=1 FL=1
MVLDDKLASCMKCGFCQAFCPVFDTTGKEGDVTRGKIALVENLAHLIIQDPEAVNEKLSRCLLCGGCQFSCPSGVPTLEIFMEARAIVTAYLGLSPVKKAIFRKLLPNPRVVDTLLRAGSPFQKLLLKDEQNPQKTACAPLLKSLFGDRQASAFQGWEGGQTRRKERPARRVLPRLYGRQDLYRRVGSLPQGF